MGKFDNGNDTWLEPFKHENNWYRVYHGTGKSKIHGVEPVDAIANIRNGGFFPSTGKNGSGARYGQGVYCTPDPAWLSKKSYVRKTKTQISTVQGTKSFESMIMGAVKPGCLHDHGSIWVVPNKEHIRPYGVLIREV